MTIIACSMEILLSLSTGADSVLWYRSEVIWLLARDSEPFGHPNQVGERFYAHLLRDVGAMKFNRSLGGGEFAGNLFTKLPSNNESDHFPLARGERDDENDVKRLVRTSIARTTMDDLASEPSRRPLKHRRRSDRSP